ncbi:hypothetical protein [Thermoactinomyces mirandus]|uniref:Lipoprotein n=1 Tax=Thermoactinomyces mirandus TaxID=2756294 RepID=A0A7W1XR93_9BACL|nr:hypothetical protein [Thermoactinomyces mirandus]MBA4601809.1 hypothetical protein [Thermoactinomyces mirandus]
MDLNKSMIMTFCLFIFLLAGCQSDLMNTLPKEVGDMDQAEEQKVRELAIDYTKKTYNKQFQVLEVSKNKATGQSYLIRGIIKDGKDTEITVILELPNEIRDTYVTTLWTEELKPEMTSLVEKHMDIRKIEHIGYSNGTKKDQYTGEVPSVFEVLKKGGDREYALTTTLRIYEENGQYEEGIKEFLQEIKAMNFNSVSVTIFVADDELKSAPKNIEESNYTLYRYNVNIDDIQKVDINNLDLDQYKTVIKH